MKSTRLIHAMLCCAALIGMCVSCGTEDSVEFGSRLASDGALGTIPEATDTKDLPLDPSAADIEAFKFDDPELPLRRRIGGLLEAYAGSCEDRDIGTQSECLHDEFLFIFTPEVAESLGLPPGEPWWGKTEELTAMGNMFEHPDVTHMTFDYRVVPGRTVRDPAGSAVGVRIEPDIRVLFERPGEEPLYLWVHDTYLDLTLVRDPDNLWVIHSMEEIHESPTLASAHLTFGGLKAMFR